MEIEAFDLFLFTIKSVSDPSKEHKRIFKLEETCWSFCWIIDHSGMELLAYSHQGGQIGVGPDNVDIVFNIRISVHFVILYHLLNQKLNWLLPVRTVYPNPLLCRSFVIQLMEIKLNIILKYFFVSIFKQLVFKCSEDSSLLIWTTKEVVWVKIGNLMLVPLTGVGVIRCYMLNFKEFEKITD